LKSALAAESDALGVAILLATAYPALAPAIEASPTIAVEIAAEGIHAVRGRDEMAARIRARLPDPSDADAARRELRRAAKRERMRIALREIVPASLGGAEVDVTARELAALGEATIEVALEEAVTALSARFGPPLTEGGGPSRFVVLGMGKLGGEELNPGSDVDLMFFYDSDEGAATAPGGASITLHDFWTRAAKRLTASLEEVTQDGFVWRVDLRLRPEGRSGPLVNSLAAAERYYEAFGRLWERAALLRAKPVAGDRGFGDEALSVLAPFIWRRRVDPGIAAEMGTLLLRARSELSRARGEGARARDPARDLKLGPGGIREAEFFVQSLMLIWGGREPRVRARGTLEGLRRLRAAGLVTDRESRTLADGYLWLRRVEHAVQVASGQQTHELPASEEDAARIARALGFREAAGLRGEIARHMEAIAELFAGLSPGEAKAPSRFTEAIAALERGKREALADALIQAAARKGGTAAADPFGRPAGGGQAEGDRAEGEGAGERAAERWRDIARDLFELSRHPDAPLGARSREAFPSLAESVLDAVIDAADPEQAARYLRTFFARVKQPGVYVRLLGDDPRAVRRLVGALGASAFLGDAVTSNPELGDVVLFARRAPRPEEARAEIEEAARQAMTGAMTGAGTGAGAGAGTGAGAGIGAEDLEDALVAALRRAKARVTLEVGLADLESEIGPSEAGATLSALADASLDAATRLALGTKEGEPLRGLAVIAMGTLGGLEIGYGSDLDVLFLFDPAAAPEGSAPEAYFTRCARRVIRLISMPHPAGPGYELDTRLRPSGSQGLLVTSIEAFARYHAKKAAPWERLALVRARLSAGDRALGAEAIRIAEAAAYGRVDDMRAAAEEIHRLRKRMERELSGERGGRYDPKLGRGGLADVELGVQLLQMAHGDSPGVRTTVTAAAIEALAAAGHLTRAQAEALREGYAFLRKLKWRIRVVHASASQLIEERAPGLAPLARRMGIRDRPGAEAAAALCSRYKAVTERVRAAYEEIIVSAAGGAAPPV
jgi:glutamate-ammonia-ligase adenylyltransferase